MVVEVVEVVMTESTADPGACWAKGCFWPLAGNAGSAGCGFYPSSSRYLSAIVVFVIHCCTWYFSCPSKPQTLLNLYASVSTIHIARNNVAWASALNRSRLSSTSKKQTKQDPLTPTDGTLPTTTKLSGIRHVCQPPGLSYPSAGGCCLS
jgi:hypothetical protein